MESLRLNNKRGLLAVVMAFAMVFAATIFVVGEVDATEPTFEDVGDADTLKQKLGYGDGTFTAPASMVYIKLTEDISVSGLDRIENVTINGGDHTLTVTGGSGNVYVGANTTGSTANVVLQNLKINLASGIALATHATSGVFNLTSCEFTGESEYAISFHSDATVPLNLTNVDLNGKKVTAGYSTSGAVTFTDCDDVFINTQEDDTTVGKSDAKFILDEKTTVSTLLVRNEVTINSDYTLVADTVLVKSKAGYKPEMIGKIDVSEIKIDDVNEGATATVDTTQTVFSGSTRISSGMTINGGIIEGSVDVDNGASVGGVVIESQGTMVVKGSLTNSVITNNGTLTIDVAVTNSGTIANYGTLNVNAVVTNTSGKMILDGSIIFGDNGGISGGEVAIQPGQSTEKITGSPIYSSVTAEGDALGLNKNLDSDYTITTKAFLEKTLVINEGVTLTVNGNAVLDLNGQQLVVLGTLVVKNNGVVTTVGDGKILIGKTGVIDNKGIIGKDSTITVGLYDPEKVSTDNYVNGTVTVKDTTGIGFGYKKEVSSGTVSYTLTISGEVSKKGSSAGTVTTSGKVYIVDGLTIGNGVTLTADGLQITKNATLEITSKGKLNGTEITIANGGTAIMDGRTDAIFKAETGSFETSKSYGNDKTKLSTTSIELNGLRGIELQVVSSSGYDERVEADVTERRLIISGDMKDSREDSDKADGFDFGLSVTGVGATAALETWMGYMGFYVDDSLVLGKEMNLIAFADETKVTVNGVVSYAGTEDANDLFSSYNPVIGTIFTVETTDENGAKTETQYIRSFDDAIGLVDTVKDKTLYVYGPVEISSEVVIAADQNVEGTAEYTITKNGKLIVSNDATLGAESVDVQGIMVVQVDGTVDIDSSITYNAKSEDKETGDITYYGFLIALQNAKAGDVIEISETTTISDSFTIPEGVTIEILSNGSIVSKTGKTVNMTVIGTLVNEGTLDISGKTDVRGSMDLTEQTSTTLTGDITVSGEIVMDGMYTASNMNGVYYQDDDGLYVYTTPSKAVAAVSEMDVGRQVTIVGKVSDSTAIVLDDVDIFVPANATANLGDVTLAKSKVKIDGTFSGTIIGKTGAEETTGAVTDTTVVLVKAQSMEIESKTTTNAQNVKVWSTTLKTTDDYYDLVGSVEVETGVLTISASMDVIDVESTVTVGTGAGLLIPKGVTLSIDDEDESDKTLMTVDGDIEIKGTLTVGGLVIVNGTMDVSKDKDAPESTVNVNDKLVITGDLVVGEDDVNGDGIVAVGNTGIIVVGAKPSTLGSSGTITGPVDIADGTAGYVLVYASGDVSAAKIEWNDAEEKSAAKSTTFNINNQPYMTVYAIGSLVTYSAVLDAADIELVGYKTDGIGTDTNWFKNVDLTEEVSAGTKVGDDDNLFYRASAVDVQFNVSVGFGISLYIDGLNIKNDTVKLSVGTHTVSATVDPGYTGTITIAFNGVTVTDGKIVVTPEMASAAYDGAKVVSATGDITTVAPEVSVEEEDEGLALTDILLIVLVVLIVIMAVIVALRMMRS